MRLVSALLSVAVGMVFVSVGARLLVVKDKTLAGDQDLRRVRAAQRITPRPPIWRLPGPCSYCCRKNPQHLATLPQS
jgi:hypothetical protein